MKRRQKNWQGIDIKDILIKVFVFVFLFTPIAIIPIWIFVTTRWQSIRNTCIVWNKWYGNCSIDWEYEWTKKINCDVANGRVVHRYTFYTTWDCYPNTDTGWIQLYNEHWIKRN